MTSTQDTIIEEVGSSVMLEPDQSVESAIGAVDGIFQCHSSWLFKL